MRRPSRSNFVLSKRGVNYPLSGPLIRVHQLCSREHARSAITKSNKALAAVGLSHKATAFPNELSGGEQQRVAIARVIVGDPSIVLADEPTGALDSENGQLTMKLLAQIAKDPSRSVLVVTHDPRTLPFANRIMHIEDGSSPATSGAGLQFN